jgi:hypothetical protein
VSPDGQEQVQVDLPLAQRIKNIGSRVDGYGMCVMSSVEMMFRWHNLEHYRGLRDWCAQQPGGAFPEKVARQLQEFTRARSVPLPPYFQYEGRDMAIIRQALASGRMVSATYSGRDGVRYRGPIDHMVNIVHFSQRWVAIMDNNGIGENEILWMTPDEFFPRWHGGTDRQGRPRNGWLVVTPAFPPPPPPRSLVPQFLAR